jgi:hypothetical protein
VLAREALPLGEAHVRVEEGRERWFQANGGSEEG